MASGDSSITQIGAGLFKAYAFETITVADSVNQLDSGLIEDTNGNAKRVVITIQNGQMRYRYDGSDPTSGVGHLVNPFDVIEMQTTGNIKALRLIRAGSTSAVISVTYER